MSAALLSAAATFIEQHGYTELTSDFFLATMPSDNNDWTQWFKAGGHVFTITYHYATTLLDDPEILSVSCKLAGETAEWPLVRIHNVGVAGQDAARKALADGIRGLAPPNRGEVVRDANAL